jgi:hypothetical protein
MGFGILSYNWILGILPTWVPWFIITIGVVLFLSEFILEALGVIPLYRIFVRLLAIFIFAHGLYIKGRQDVIVGAKEEVKQAVIHQKQVSNKVITHYRKQLNEVKAKNEQIKKTANSKDDAMCNLPRSFVKLHNSAVENTVPDTSKGTDGASSGVALSTAEGVIVDNYGIYHQVAEQLKALQDWVKEQSKAN